MSSSTNDRRTECVRGIETEGLVKNQTQQKTNRSNSMHLKEEEEGVKKSFGEDYSPSNYLQLYLGMWQKAMERQMLNDIFPIV